MLKSELIPGIDAAIKILKTIPIIIIIIPKYKQFFDLRGSSWRKIKNAIIPPITPKNIGSRNHALLLGFSGYDMIFHNYFEAAFFCN